MQPREEPPADPAPRSGCPGPAPGCGPAVLRANRARQRAAQALRSVGAARRQARPGRESGAGCAAREEEIGESEVLGRLDDCPTRSCFVIGPALHPYLTIIRLIGHRVLNPPGPAALSGHLETVQL